MTFEISPQNYLMTSVGVEDTPSDRIDAENHVRCVDHANKDPRVGDVSSDVNA